MNASMAAKPHLRPGSIDCDFNTLTRKNAEDIGATLADAGIDYVDVAVMGGFNALGYKVPLLLAGPAAPRVLGWMAPLGFAAKVLSDRIGVARSEERRVGKEGVGSGRSRWWPAHYKTKNTTNH